MSKPKNQRPLTPAPQPVVLPSFERLYWLRLGFAAVAGYAANAIGADPSTGISIGIALYLVSYYLARLTWYRGMGREGQGKVYTTGIGGYVLLFLFTWILFFTVQTAGYSL